jgi:uncharacterized membrane protein
VVIASGLAITFITHPDYTSSRTILGELTAPGAHYPNTLLGVMEGVARFDGESIVMAGLLLLIATPLSRVALSIILFVIARDKLYAAITAAVLLILLVAFAIGLDAR